MPTEKETIAAEQGADGAPAICLREKSTECVCPKCGAKHRLKMAWTGRGKPRKFCPICKHYSSSINDAEPCDIASQSAQH